MSLGDLILIAVGLVVFIWTTVHYSRKDNKRDSRAHKP